MDGKRVICTSAAVIDNRERERWRQGLVCKLTLKKSRSLFDKRGVHVSVYLDKEPDQVEAEQERIEESKRK